MRNRRGFSLIEVMVALVILSVVLLGLGRFVASFLHTVGTTTTKTAATEAASGFMATIQADPAYPLPATYTGTVTGFATFPNMKRVTTFNRINSANRDYTIVTVKVTEPTLADTVNITAVVARP
jgi:prepilin-type N-terminal cleavage/methylation domain-containing protein